MRTWLTVFTANSLTIVPWFEDEIDDSKVIPTVVGEAVLFVTDHLLTFEEYEALRKEKVSAKNRRDFDFALEAAQANWDSMQKVAA